MLLLIAILCKVLPFGSLKLLDVSDGKYIFCKKKGDYEDYMRNTSLEKLWIVHVVKEKGQTGVSDYMADNLSDEWDSDQGEKKKERKKKRKRERYKESWKWRLFDITFQRKWKESVHWLVVLCN